MGLSGIFEAGPIALIVNSSIKTYGDVILMPKLSLPKQLKKIYIPSVSKSCFEHCVFQWLCDLVKHHIHGQKRVITSVGSH